MTFVVPGDLHLTEAGLDNHRVALRVVDEVNDLIRPDFVQFIGDNVQDATEAQFRLFDDLRGRLDVPHFALVGDHDVKDDPEAPGLPRARRARPTGRPRSGASASSGSTPSRPGRWASRPSRSTGSAAEVDAALASGERVVVFQHNYPYQIWEDFDGPGIDDWRAIVQTRRIAAIVCGHTHYWQVANDGRNVAVAARSIGDPEGGPPGYLVGHVRGDDLAFAYRTVEDEGPLVLVTHPREAILATGPPHVVARPRPVPGPDLVGRRRSPRSGRGSTTASGSRSSPTAPATGRPPCRGDRLAKGEHAFEVEAVDARTAAAAGTRSSSSVDPTGRYTAVPAARPRVTGRDSADVAPEDPVPAYSPRLGAQATHPDGAAVASSPGSTTPRIASRSTKLGQGSTNRIRTRCRFGETGSMPRISASTQGVPSPSTRRRRARADGGAWPGDQRCAGPADVAESAPDRPPFAALGPGKLHDRRRVTAAVGPGRLALGTGRRGEEFEDPIRLISHDSMSLPMAVMANRATTRAVCPAPVRQNEPVRRGRHGIAGPGRSGREHGCRVSKS